MKKFRILLLDSDVPKWLWLPKNVGSTKVIIIQEEGFWKDGYREAVWQEAQKADLIVIGNTFGAGRRETTNIPDKAKARAVVVFNHPPDPDDTFDYERRGFSRFGARSGLKSRIRRILKPRPVT